MASLGQQNDSFPFLGICADEIWCKRLRTSSAKKTFDVCEGYNHIFKKGIMSSPDIRVYDSTATFIQREGAELDRLNFGVNINNTRSQDKFAVLFIYSTEKGEHFFTDGYATSPGSDKMLQLTESLDPLYVPMVCHQGCVDFIMLLSQVTEEVPNGYADRGTNSHKANEYFDKVQMEHKASPVAIYNVRMNVIVDEGGYISSDKEDEEEIVK
uniref:Uncharacterized protein n=1 Tax=Chionoecetes opilio bacilliform virus TaxID=1825681 RepID=A0A1Q3DLC1_9VIRU|nr:wsv390-like protein [Chionoecetes opilio bacilliform virus]GAV93179.1 hypothetical protein SCV_055 [Chionoecetes opilio bacilliform virus]